MSDAREFLRKNDLDGLTKIIVEDNKFETLDDLKLLSGKQQFFDALHVPICWQIKFANALNELKENNDACTNGKFKPAVTIRTNDDSQGSSTGGEEQISKKRLVELAKSNMTAQAVNLKYNDLNKILLAEMRRVQEKFKGAGALKRCDKTSEEDAKINMALVDEIVDTPSLTKFYGSFQIGKDGVFTINRAKVKLLLGRKLSQERKPSAYKRKIISCDDLENKEDTTSKKTREIKDNKGRDKSNKDLPAEAGEDQLCNYEVERQHRIDDNQLAMLNNNIIPQSMAIIGGLFYLKTRKISDVSQSKIKKSLNALKVAMPKQQSTKENLVYLLGKHVLEAGIIQRIDSKKVITRDNLVRPNLD